MNVSIRLISLLLLVLLTASPAGAGDFTVVTNTAPPIKFVKDGMISGIAGDVLAEIMRRAGFKLDKGDIRVMSLTEGYDFVKATPGTLCVSLARTPERESDFKWVGSTYSTQLGFIAKKDRNIRLNSTDSAKRFTVGSVIASAPEVTLKDQGFTEDDFIRHEEPQEAIRALSEGRVDLLAFPKSPAYTIMMRAGISPDDYEMVHEFKTVEVYIAFNRGTSDDTIARLQAALDHLKKPDASGSSAYSRIVSAYFTPNL